MRGECNPFLGGVSCVDDLLEGAGDKAGEMAESAVASAWESVCESFAEAAGMLLAGFAEAFVAFPNVDLTSDAISGVFAMSMGLGIVVAVILLLLQAGRTAITHDGRALAEALIGVGKTALAFVLTLTLASTALLVADELSMWILERSFESVEELDDKLVALMAANIPNPTVKLVLAVVAIVLVIVLWFELLLRNGAVAVLVATSPIAAAGMVSGATKQWWSKLVAATIQLIMLKPAIALIFAIGFSLVGDGEDIATLLTGMLVLLLAVIAWPAIMRFFTWTNASVGGGAGAAAALGFASGHVSARAGTAGIAPREFSQAAEART
ncbi:MAG: hypothetical protein ACRDXX_01045, partial [Stackebrandtia sp.]